jgi:hypothetical protein
LRSSFCFQTTRQCIFFDSFPDAVRVLSQPDNNAMKIIGILTVAPLVMPKAALVKLGMPVIAPKMKRPVPATQVPSKLPTASTAVLLPLVSSRSQ